MGGNEKNKGGRPLKFTREQYLDAIVDSGGLKSVVADKLGCDVNTVTAAMNRWATVARAMYDEDERTTDLAEIAAKKAIVKGYWPAIKWRLATKGKNRGYTTEQSIDVKSGGKPLVKSDVIVIYGGPNEGETDETEVGD